MEKVKIIYTTPTGEKTVTCDRFESSHGEGVNGPFVLRFFEGTGENEQQVGGASRVTDFTKE